MCSINDNHQGLIEKKQVDIHKERGVVLWLISIVTEKIATQRWSEILIMKRKQVIHYICFLFSHYYVYIMLLTWSKSWNYIYWLLLVLTRIKLGHAQISVPKINILVSKTACIKPRYYDIWFLWYWAWRTDFFVVLDHLLPFYLHSNPKTQTFEKTGKKSLEILSFYTCVP